MKRLHEHYWILPPFSQQEDSEGEATLSYQTLKSINLGLVLVVLLVGIFGNGVIIYTFGILRRKERQTVEFLFLLLGITDLVSCFVAAPIQAYESIVRPSGETVTGHIIMTKFLPTFWPLSFLMSESLLVIICVNRYIAVVNPFEERMKPKSIVLVCVAIFVFGLALYLPFSLITVKGATVSSVNGTHFPQNGGERVTARARFVKNIHLYFAHGFIDLSRDLIGLGIMAALIHKILRVLKEGQKSLKGSYQEGYIERRNKDVRKTLVTVIAVFTICVLPFDILCFSYGMRLLLFGHPPHSHELILAPLHLYLRTLQISNCSANIFVYSFMHPAFESWRAFLIKNVCFCNRFLRYLSEESEIKPITQSSDRLGPPLSAQYMK